MVRIHAGQPFLLRKMQVWLWPIADGRMKIDGNSVDSPAAGQLFCLAGTIMQTAINSCLSVNNFYEENSWYEKLNL